MSRRQLIERMLDLGFFRRYSSTKKAARRATVLQLWWNCTDEEIARFTRSSVGTIRRDRRMIRRMKYSTIKKNSPYIRPSLN